MPIWMRRFYIKEISKFNEERNQEMEKQHTDAGIK